MTDSSPSPPIDWLLAELTLEAKIGLVHGPMGVAAGGAPKPATARGSAGHNPGVPR